MSEVPASSNPETSTPSVFNAAETLDLEAIEILRLEQKSAVEDAQQQVFVDQVPSDFVLGELKKDAVHDSIVDYLRQQGLDQADPKFEAYVNGLSELSIINAPESEWYASSADDDGNLGQSGRDKARVIQRELAPEEFIVQPLPSANAAPTPPVPEVLPAANAEQRERLVAELEALREKMAIQSAKRQGSLLDLGIEKYDQALEAYNAKFTELARLELADDLANDTLDQTEKNALVIGRYFEEQNKLRALTKNKLENSVKGKFINMLTSGTKGKRFLKAAGFGLVAAGVGALAGGAIAGVAGTAAVAGGVAATVTAAARFAKGYAQADAKKGYGMKGLTDKHVADARRDAQFNPDDDIFDRVQTKFGRQLEHDTKKEKQKRWKSVAMGVGAAAMGGVLATSIAIASDFAGSGSAGEWLNRNDVIAEIVNPDQPTLGVHDYTPGAFENTIDVSTPEVPAFDPNFSIDSGEGGIAFFQSLGLNESQWYEVAGELRNNFPNEFYTEGYDVRIAQRGQLSIEAQQFIKNRFGL